jgi:hypothetical protein
MSAPDSRRCVAKEWRKVWQVERAPPLLERIAEINSPTIYWTII